MKAQGKSPLSRAGLKEQLQSESAKVSAAGGRHEEAVEEVEEVLAVGAVMPVEVGVPGEEVVQEVEEVLAVHAVGVVPVARTRIAAAQREGQVVAGVGAVARQAFKGPATRDRSDRDECDIRAGLEHRRDDAIASAGAIDC